MRINLTSVKLKHRPHTEDDIIWCFTIRRKNFNEFSLQVK